MATKQRTYIGRLWRSVLRGTLDGVPVVSQFLAVNDEMKRRKAEEVATGPRTPWNTNGAAEPKEPTEEGTLAVPRLAVSLSVVLALVYAVHRGWIPAERLFAFLERLLPVMP